jgi:hypothetical protein
MQREPGDHAGLLQAQESRGHRAPGYAEDAGAFA